MRPTHSRLLSLALIAACNGGSPTGPPYDPQIGPADFVSGVTNPYFPLPPGTRWEYQSSSERNTVEVLPATRTTFGVEATVVLDRVYENGVLTEETFDWYAQDKDGTVWYLGEDSREIEHGQVVSTEGSWEAGVDGAKPGVIMWANPAAHLDEDYRQEFARGTAEDWGKVVGVSESVQVPAGSYTGCVKTEDWSGLEGRSKSLERKYYCATVGLVLESGGNGERLELIGVVP